LLHVYRAKPGMEVILFDGRGSQYPARVVAVERKCVQLEVMEQQQRDCESPRRVTLGVGLPKGDRQHWLVEKSVELGVAELVPLVTARSVAVPGAAAMARLRRTVVEASKQCGRNILMDLATPQTLGDYLREASPDACRVLVHPAADTETTAIADWPLRREGREFCLAVGPEGGFTEQEIALAYDNGWRVAGLGPRILRVETAALTLVAGINY
jgi:16S rRNA (uracil1498-N3)-methyltransferase